MPKHYPVPMAYCEIFNNFSLLFLEKVKRRVGNWRSFIFDFLLHWMTSRATQSYSSYGKMPNWSNYSHQPKISRSSPPIFCILFKLLAFVQENPLRSEITSAISTESRSMHCGAIPRSWLSNWPTYAWSRIFTCYIYEKTHGQTDWLKLNFY